MGRAERSHSQCRGDGHCLHGFFDKASSVACLGTDGRQELFCLMNVKLLS
jgi:hypothetical protein